MKTLSLTKKKSQGVKLGDKGRRFWANWIHGMLYSYLPFFTVQLTTDLWLVNVLRKAVILIPVSGSYHWLSVTKSMRTHGEAYKNLVLQSLKSNFPTGVVAYTITSYFICSNMLLYLTIYLWLTLKWVR